MCIFTHLHNEHQEVKQLLDKIADLGNEDHARKMAIFYEFQEKLLAHAKAEEEALYERLKDFSALDDKMRHSEHEHHEAESLIDELNSAELVGAAWQSKFLKLKSEVEHHIAEEEGRVFPIAKQKIDEQEAKEIEAQMQTREQQLLSA